MTLTGFPLMNSRFPAFAACTVLFACGGSDKNVADSTAAAPAQNSLMFMAQEFSFSAPDSIPAGFTRVSVMNHGTEPHHAVLVRLDSGHVAGEFLDALAKNRIPAWAVFMGGPNAADVGMGEVIVDLAPGNYVTLCLVPSPDGTPHFAKGMVRTLTVVEPQTETAAPESDLTITLSDYAFTASSPLTPGRHVIRVENTAAQPHELLIVKLEPGKSLKEFAAWAEKPQGPAPGKLMGGTTPQAAGIVNYLVADFEAGEYGFLCFVPDAKDGKLHVAHGMLHQFTIS
jgi:hypothetical protein